jgi:hypothetical protein
MEPFPGKPSGRSQGQTRSFSSSASQRGVTSGRVRSTRRAPFPIELIIAIGVLTILLVVCGVLYSMRSSERRKAEDEKRQRDELERKNVDLAYQTLLRAESAGAAYVTGKMPEMKDEGLFAPFRSDDRIYNVRYSRRYRDRRGGTRPEQKDLFPERLQFQKSTRVIATKDNGAVTIMGGMVDNAPILMASKSYSSDKDDKVNLGGEIMVIVKAYKE